MSTTALVHLARNKEWDSWYATQTVHVTEGMDAALYIKERFKQRCDDGDFEGYVAFLVEIDPTSGECSVGKLSDYRPKRKPIIEYNKPKGVAKVQAGKTWISGAATPTFSSAQLFQAYLDT